MLDISNSDQTLKTAPDLEAFARSVRARVRVLERSARRSALYRSCDWRSLDHTRVCISSQSRSTSTEVTKMPEFAFDRGIRTGLFRHSVIRGSSATAFLDYGVVGEALDAVVDIWFNFSRCTRALRTGALVSGRCTIDILDGPGSSPAEEAAHSHVNGDGFCSLSEVVLVISLQVRLGGVRTA